eukprot:1179778-Rhodomonas_salina.4
MLQRGISIIILSIYVDDGIAATNDEKLYKSFLAELAKDFELSYQGVIKWCLGVQINQDKPNGCISMSQAQYVKDMQARFGMTGATPCLTQLEPNVHLTRADCLDKAQVDKAFCSEYQRIVGSLMYLASFTRPDICHAARKATNVIYELTYESQADVRANLLWGFADSDHAGDPDTRRSVTGYVTMLNRAAISWGSTRQQVVALSSLEAEFYAASVAGCNVSHHRMLLDQLGYAQREPTVVFEDNWACIHLSRNSVLHHKSKHIDVRVYHLSQHESTQDRHQ